ncbi:MAG: hypothetical protein WBB28_10700 [Crinalium sp.]
MDKFWKRWHKPWTKQQCEQVYIQGGISTRQIAAESGVSERTVARWSTAGGWVKKRQQFDENVTAKTTQKVIEKVSENRATKLIELSDEHAATARELRQLARFIVQAKTRELTEAKAAGQTEFSKMIDNFYSNSNNLNYLSLCVSRALQDEARATGLNYAVNADAAAAYLESLGYQVIDPSEEPEAVAPSSGNVLYL